ncbi:MAG: carboxypeptidase regulatory-like domain-containing protein [Planctomycetaceae bacterium]|nr:carboxypeptidase regulatory-like domain-containing protein [Planctomycetaceae bacterium]
MHRSSSRTLIRHLPGQSVMRSALAALSLVLLAGCGGSSEVAKQPVTGRVTFDGEAVTEGTVNFFSPETGAGASAPLDSTGSFKMEEGIPAGTYKVSIQPPSQEVAAGAPEPENPKEYPNIPEKYRSDTTSGLTANVTDGENSFDFPLAPDQP